MIDKEKLFFNSSSNPTIGVEVELYTVSNNDLDLYPGAPSILDFYSNDLHIKEELLDCIIEINTGICENVNEVREDLYKKIFEVNQIAQKNNFSLISMGTHPFAKWKNQRITDSQRYINFLERMQWPVRRLIISGLHVHIGVENGEKAIAITNGMARYIPILIGLSANSPYFGGEYTGLASTRTKIFEGLPTTGIPPILKNYSEFQKFMRTLQKANTIQSIREVWWDIRPHPNYGTVEIRVCDAVPTISEMVNLSALIQCLVVGLSNHYDDGSQLELLDPWIIQDNKWRATRYGLDANIIIDDNGNLQNIKGMIVDTIERLMPIANELECSKELNELVEIVENNSPPYIRQIIEFEKNNNFKEIIKFNINELKKDFEFEQVR